MALCNQAITITIGYCIYYVESSNTAISHRRIEYEAMYYNGRIPLQINCNTFFNNLFEKLFKGAIFWFFGRNIMLGTCQPTPLDAINSSKNCCKKLELSDNPIPSTSIKVRQIL